MERAAGEGRARERWLRLVLIGLALLTGALGVTKLLLQREHPPAFALSAHNSYQGFVAIDEYALRAELAREVLLGREGATQRFREALLTGLHPASFLVPVAVAAVSLCGLGVPAAFASLSYAAAVAAAWIAGRIARRLVPGAPPAVGLLAAVLVLGHLLVVRTAAQLHMDPFCALWVAAATLLVLEWRERPRATLEVALLALLTTGLWVKVSLAPLLVVPAVVTVLDGGWKQPLRVLRQGALFGLLPALGWLAVLAAIGGLDRILVDVDDQAGQFNFTGWRYLGDFGIEMLLLFQLFPLACVLPRPQGLDRGRQRVVLVVLVLVLVATWVFRLPPIPRLYLPVPALLAALVAPRLAGYLRAGAGRWLLGLHLVANYALAVLALQMSLG